MLSPEAKIEVVTPQQAKIWLEKVDHKRQKEIQRDLSSAWVKHLAKEMTLGRFVPTNNIFFCFCNGVTYLVNGQHTLNAVVESGKSQELAVIRKTCTAEQEVEEFYYRSDGGRARSFADGLNTLSVVKTTGLGNTEISRIDSSLRLIHHRFGIPNRSKKIYYSYDDRVRAALMWVEEYKKFKSYIKDGVQSATQKMIGQGVMALALVTIRQQEELAEPFWHQVAHDDKIAADDPRKTLHRWLLTAWSQGGGAKARDTYPVESFVYAASRAWNAFYENRNLSRLVVTAKRIRDLSGINLEMVFRELDAVYNEDLSTKYTEQTESSI